MSMEGQQTSHQITDKSSSYYFPSAHSVLFFIITTVSHPTGLPAAGKEAEEPHVRNSLFQKLRNLLTKGSTALY